MKYGEWLQIWLEDYVRPVEKQKTYKNYSDIIRLRLHPNFGECEINELSVTELQHYITGLLTNGNMRTGEGLANTTIDLIISVIKSSLKRAYLIGYADAYIGDKIKSPKYMETEVDCFSETEQKKIEFEIQHQAKTKLYGIILCLYSGLRIGELLALEWSDIDFTKELLTVSKTCYDAKDENGDYLKIVDTPKTRSSWRRIPLPRQIMPMLQEMRDESRSNYVIADKEKTVRVRSYQRSYELLLKRLNIPHKKFHALRHTFATRAIECGMDVKTLSEILGHKSPTVTLKLYVHSLYEHKKEMMNLVGALY